MIHVCIESALRQETNVVINLLGDAQIPEHTAVTLLDPLDRLRIVPFTTLEAYNLDGFWRPRAWHVAATNPGLQSALLPQRRIGHLPPGM